MTPIQILEKVVNSEKYLNKMFDDKLYHTRKSSPVLDTAFSVGANYSVHIRNRNTVPFTDYRQAEGEEARTGPQYEVLTDTQTYVLDQRKTFRAVLDLNTYDDTGRGLPIASWVANQKRTELVKILDTHAFSRIVAKALGKSTPQKTTTLTISKTNAYETVVKDITKILKRGVELNDREELMIFMHHDIEEAVKLDDKYSRNTDLGQRDQAYKGMVGSISGCPVFVVPQDRFPANVNFIICRKNVPKFPVRHMKTRLNNKVPGIFGVMVEMLVVYACFLFDNESDAVQVNMTT